MILRQWFRRLGPGLWTNWPLRAYRQRRYQLRLAAVQEHLSERLDAAPAGPVRIISICAGDGRDLLGVLEAHHRRNDVTAWLIEQSSQSVIAGSARLTSLGLDSAVRFLHADATLYATYQAIAPADIVLLCGVWGHVPVHERTRVIRALACVCKSGGTVIWSRSVAKGLGQLDQIQSLFRAPSWERIGLTLTPDKSWAVATHRHCGRVVDPPPDGQIFHFSAGAGTR
jgi:hypothetical protein